MNLVEIGIQYTFKYLNIEIQMIKYFWKKSNGFN